MSPERKQRVGILFGGRSVEHEVSVITGIQAAHALDEKRYEPVPIYVSKEGSWYAGEHLLDLKLYKKLTGVTASAKQVRPEPNASGGIDLVDAAQKWFGRPSRVPVDVLLLAMHGAEGENGSLQGALEVLNVPYTGCDVPASAIGMDKQLSKTIARSVGIPVLDEIVIRENDWVASEESWLDRCESRFGYPVIVKPSRLGSSIGIGRATDRAELDSILEDAYRLDPAALVEPCITNLREFNCSVLGDTRSAEASVIEEPVRASDSDVLSFEQKYHRDRGKSGAKSGEQHAGMASLDRVIPAEVPGDRASHLQEMSLKVFKAVGCSGVARIDFLYDVDAKAFYFNEINTIPGSFSFYLWEPSGVPFPDLLDRLVKIAIDRHRSKNGKIRSYDTNLLSEDAVSSLKGK